MNGFASRSERWRVLTLNWAARAGWSASDGEGPGATSSGRGSKSTGRMKECSGRRGWKGRTYELGRFGSYRRHYGGRAEDEWRRGIEAIVRAMEADAWNFQAVLILVSLSQRTKCYAGTIDVRDRKNLAGQAGLANYDRRERCRKCGDGAPRSSWQLQRCIYSAQS